ncbi:hypothetical protein [Streptomyces sp. CS62]|uniref:hypothetical protein n=1 Tax=Streptomyces sp. CS62 TaxID=3119268 RepID=UPI002F948724
MPGAAHTYQPEYHRNRAPKTAPKTAPRSTSWRVVRRSGRRICRSQYPSSGSSTIMTMWLYGRIGSRNSTVAGTAMSSAQKGRSRVRQARYAIGPATAVKKICRSCRAKPVSPRPW